MNFPRGKQQNHFKTILQFRNSRKREKSNKNWFNLNAAFSNNWSKVLKSARNFENHILHFMQWAPAKCVCYWIDMFSVHCTEYTPPSFHWWHIYIWSIYLCLCSVSIQFVAPAVEARLSILHIMRAQWVTHTLYIVHCARTQLITKYTIKNQ